MRRVEEEMRKREKVEEERRKREEEAAAKNDSDDKSETNTEDNSRFVNNNIVTAVPSVCVCDYNLREIGWMWGIEHYESHIIIDTIARLLTLASSGDHSRVPTVFLGNSNLFYSVLSQFLHLDNFSGQERK